MVVKEVPHSLNEDETLWAYSKDIKYKTNSTRGNGRGG